MGTNTFNLLVAEGDGSRFSIVYRNTIGVMLGKGGINSGTIAPEAYQRGLLAFDEHMTTAKELGVEEVKAFATSAIRSASNGGDFVDELAGKYGIDVEVISGDREAELIFKGVAASMDMDAECVLIMDIGGGSNEFIICDRDGILWKQSFPLGMSRLLEKFKPSDPIHPLEVDAVEAYLTEGLEPLWEACQQYQPQVMVGASGAFDTFRSVICLNSTEEPICNIEMAEFEALHHCLVLSTLAQRRLIRGMDELRVEMIVLASIAASLVLRKAAIGQLIQSDYSLKEGAAVELLGGAVK
jgi:exopolyphosphatase/guanosine-5'-triphosphate,3'-diphosphate pyrophosphatase